MGGRQWRRQGIALVACFLWLLGTEALPALHQAHHDDHHTHATDGTVIDHGTHHHVVKKKPGKHHRDQLAIDHPIGFGHQAAGVAHHAIAMLQAVSPALSPVVRLEARVAVPPIKLPVIAIGTQPSARGPPANT